MASGSCIEAAFNFDNVHSRLILVEAVQHDLTLAGSLVGQLYFGEADGVLGPVAAVVWGVRVNVYGVVRCWFSFTT